MDGKWLIRTTHNQILGPVTKQKLLEFMEKSALGMLDEVCCGNGYWFSLKEKDLVEKYIHGDVPQGYNPISESRSVLSNIDNPNKTASIYSSPANNPSSTIGQSKANSTQIIKLDLESLNSVSATGVEPTKLPNQDDLEFPDVDLIASSVSVSFDNGELGLKASLTSAKIPMPIPRPSHVMSSESLISAQEVILPDADDLAFPDMDDNKTSPKVSKGNVDLSHQYTRTVALDIQQASVVLPQETKIEVLEDNLSFEVPLVLETAPPAEAVVEKIQDLHKTHNVAAQAATPARIDRNNVKITGASSAHYEDKKLLHDRKTKANMSKGAALRDPTRENHSKDVQVDPPKRNDNYIFFILIILVLIILAIFFYFKEILNKPLPM